MIIWNRLVVRWKAQRQAREEAHRQRVEALIALYPDDDPFLVASTLNPHRGIALAAVTTLTREAEQRHQDARLRRILREELKVVGDNP